MTLPKMFPNITLHSDKFKFAVGQLQYEGMSYKEIGHMMSHLKKLHHSVSALKATYLGTFVAGKFKEMWQKFFSA